MRRNLLLSVCFLMASVLFAGPVTKQQAQEMAAQFLAGKSITHRASSASQMHVKVVMNAVDEAGQPYLYAVQPDNQRGFVIVSGDDRFRDVLGYSESGTFDNANMPDNMRAWLQGYVDEMKHLKAIGYQPSASAAHRTSGVKKAISPLIQTRWNQGAPYNDICKYYFQYNDAVTGCVATAMAQVMYYSAQKHGDNTYTTTVEIPGYNTGYNYPVPAVDVKTVINWSNMLPEYTYSYNNNTKKYDISNFTSEQGTAVAKLMQCCGVSVHMDYANSASGGSSASISEVPNALITYFGYDETVRYESRGMYTLATWTELIYDELAAARPVLYGGQSSGGGHAFVVDGYDGDELFHVNWGWGGSQDNYFALSVMNPGDNSGIGASTSNDGYSFGQEAVIGIQIGSGQTYSEPKKMTFKELSISGNVIHTKVRNYNNETLTFNYGFGYIDEFGNVEQFGVHTYQFGYMYGNDDFYTTISGTAKPAGTYKIVRISRLNGTTDWVVQDDEYVEAVFDGSSVTLTKHPVVSLEAQTFNFTGTKYVNEVQPIEVAIKNNGDEFYGTLYLFASTTETKGEYKNLGGVTITKGSTATMTFEFEPTSTGTYNVWVATDQAGSNVVGHTTVSIGINAHAPAGPFIISALSVTDADETSWTTDGNGNILVDVYSKTIEVAPTIKNISNTNYGGLTVRFYLQKWDGSAWVNINNVYANEFSINAGKTAPFNAIGYGIYDYGKYRIVLNVNGNEYDTRYTLNLTMGYNTTNANGNLVRVKTDNSSVSVAADAVAVDLSDFDYTDITPNSNPNTLYIIGGSQTAPTSLDGKNVVKDGTIGTLNLTDGYAFSTPVDFHANNVTYTRTFNSYYNNGEGWTTLMLPFEATVSNSDGNLTWYDPDRRFWLMEFSGDAGSSVNFSHATGTTIKANTPYIIALPGAAYGEYSLEGGGKNTLTFTATDVDFTANAKASSTGSNYKFVGTTTNTSNKVKYKLNAAGNSFAKGTVTESPFRAYFEGTSTAATATSLGISFGGNTTGIAEIDTLLRVEDNKFYNLNGQRVSQPKKGLYIVNGKKVVIK